MSAKTAELIDRRVERLLKDLGDPAPPLRLDDVRALLRLDLAYYSSTDDSWLREKLHQMKVAGKQVLERPASILSIVRRLGLKGILLAEQRRILLDNEIPAKLRWNEGHEIIHDALPWHEGIAHGDPEMMLHPACHELIEAEANYGAGRLLFLGRAFEEVVRSTSADFATVQSLHVTYENTITTTLWRVVELSLEPTFGLVTNHPKRVTRVPAGDIRYFIRSPRFAAEFTAVKAEALFAEVRQRCYGWRGPLGAGEFVVTDDRGEGQVFRFQTFFNGHDALTLGRRVSARPCAVTVKVPRGAAGSSSRRGKVYTV